MAAVPQALRGLMRLWLWGHAMQHCHGLAPATATPLLHMPLRGTAPTLAPLAGHAQSLAALRGGFVGMQLPPLDPDVARLTWDSMAELLTSCAIGFTATRIGLLSGSNVQSLATVVFNVFLPAMLVTSVARTVAQAGLGSLLVVPLAAWVQVAVGIGVGTLSLLVLRMPRRSPAGRGIAVLSAFGNSGVLPLIFVNSLFQGVAAEATRQRATSLVAMYLLGWSPLFWTIGYALLTGRLVAASEDGESAAAAEHAERAALHAASPGPRRHDATASPSQQPAWVAVAMQRTLALRAGLRRVVTPPILALLVGLLVGSVPALHRRLVPSASLAGGGCPLPLYRCLDNLGRAYSPAALLVLAGSLGAATDGERPQPHELGHSYTHVLAISLARFAVVPACSFGLLQLALRVGVLPADPLRDFVLLLQSCMPSAQNAVLALQVDNTPLRAARMARILLAIYLVAAGPVAGTLSFLLQRYSGGIGLQATLAQSRL